MGLGIRRGMVGDIVVEEEQAYLFAETAMCQHIASVLTSAGRVHLQVTQLDELPVPVPPEGREVRDTVSSPRLDAVISGGFSISRAKAAALITGVSSNPIVIALLLNLILLILGMVMDMAPIILISTPILLPIATSIGISPITYGIMLMLNCGIGLLTPPVGSVLFIGSAVAKVPMERVVKAMLPFYLCMIAALLLITFIPQITLFLPSLFM